MPEKPDPANAARIKELKASIKEREQRVKDAPPGMRETVSERQKREIAAINAQIEVLEKGDK